MAIKMERERDREFVKNVTLGVTFELKPDHQAGFHGANLWHGREGRKMERRGEGKGGGAFHQLNHFNL